MDDQPKHSASFPPPVFASRALRARMLIEASGLRFVWNEEKNEFVLSDRKAVKRVRTMWKALRSARNIKLDIR
jgi:hypothetical protein